MIPQNITNHHVLLAIEEIRQNGIPEKNHSKRYSVPYEGKLYPPKLLISYANRHANGVELPSADFSGGDQSNNLLRHLGFEIVSKSTSGAAYPFESYSWRIESPTLAIKTTDRSCFLHHGTGIPAEIYWFFGIDEKQETADWNIRLRSQGQEFNAHLQQDITLKRWRLFWKADFDEFLRTSCPDWYTAFEKEDEPQGNPPLLRFSPLNEAFNEYSVELILKDVIDSDGEGLSDDPPENGKGNNEGGKRAYQGTRYERDSYNRERAIELHGTKCSVCQFDFGQKYGSRGTGFIEIHHKNPLATQEGSHPVDPKEDLAPVCSNCHRMIHRRKESILNIEELRKLLTS